MKKLLLIPVALLALSACNNDSTTETKKEDTATTTTNTNTPPPEVPITENPDYKAGLALIAQSDCLTCHSVNDKINGPAYKDVANKYATAGDTIVTHLAKKIITGGAGVWGEVPMTPHPQISQADAEQMVKYVLLLKK
jgi:cytochrome c